MNHFLKSKKGTLFDVVAIMMFALLFGICCFVAYDVWVQFSASGTVTSAKGVGYLAGVSDTFNALDSMFMFILVGLGIVTAIAASRIQTSPAFFFFSAVLLSIMIYLAAQFSNIFEKIATNASFVAAATKFDAVTYVMAHLPMTILGLGIVIIVVMYAVTNIEI